MVQLRQRRLERGWSLDDVAEQLHRLAREMGEPVPGVDRQAVSRWERGTHRPRPYYTRLLSALYEASPIELGLVDSPQKEEVIHELEVSAPCADHRDLEGPEKVDDLLQAMHRREFMLGAFGLAMAGSVEPWERLSRVLSHPGRIDRATVDHLERVSVALERLEPQADPRTLLGAASGHLETITFLLGNPLHPSIRRELCSIAGETAGVAGRLRWILDDDIGAAAYYDAGLQAAREAGDAALGAYLLGQAACRPFYREVPQARLQALAGARGCSASDATPRTRAWLAMLEAEAHSLIGDEVECLGALERATANLSSAGGDESPRPRISFFDDVWLTGQSGACFAQLGRLDEARFMLDQALQALDMSWVKQRTWLLTLLAETFARLEAPEEACRTGTEALASATKVGAMADLQLVQRLADKLRPWSASPAVQEFSEAVRAGLQG